MMNPSAVLHAVHDLRVEERPVPTPAAHQVLVEIAATGICGSDVHYYEHGRVGGYVVDAPMVLGHESAGVVVAVGASVAKDRLGQLVALEPGVACRHCDQCVLGDYNLCRNMRFFATPPVNGSLARYVLIDAEFAHVAPAALSAEQAAMAEPVSVGIWAARRTGVTAGTRVLVTGAGPVGLFAAQVARAFGSEVPVLTDVNPYRLDRATRLGLRTAPHQVESNEEFDVLLECSGAEAALANGLRQLAPRGRVALVGMGRDLLTVDLPLVQGRELTLSGVFRYAHTYPLALRLIAEGLVEVTAVISHRLPIERAREALTLHRTDPETLKVVVTGSPNPPGVPLAPPPAG